MAKYNDLDALTRSDMEDDLAEWMDEIGIDNSWELAPTFVEMGCDTDKLQPLVEEFTPDQTGVIMQWLGANYQVKSLLAEIDQGAGRISEIVKSLKIFAGYRGEDSIGCQVSKKVNHSLG